MNLTISYFNDELNNIYSDAVKYKNNGNYIKSKKKLLEAISILEKLANLDMPNRDQYLNRIKRINYVIKMMPKNNVVYSNQGNQKTGDLEGKTSNVSCKEHNGYRLLNDPKILSFCKIIDPKNIEFNFNDLVGLEEPIEAFNENVIYPSINPEEYENLGLNNNVCILLEGMPGTGKTSFAKAAAKETNGLFIKVNVHNLVSCYVGESAKNINEFFEAVREYVIATRQHIIIFFDEFDSVAKSRNSDDKTSATTVTALLNNLDGMDSNDNLLVLANTNCKDELDGAILDRFNLVINIPLPNFEGRKELFVKKLENLEKEETDRLNFDLLAEKTEGFSGRRIEFCCKAFKSLIYKIRVGITPPVEDYNKEFLLIINKVNK